MSDYDAASRADDSPAIPPFGLRDEFSDLACAANSVSAELERRRKMPAPAHKLGAIGTLTAGVARELNNPIVSPRKPLRI